MNDFGKTGYSGPCPPSGEHRYVFHLYALDSHSLQLPAKARRRDLDAAMSGHVLGKGRAASRDSIATRRLYK